MSSINDAYVNALLADATYANALFDDMSEDDLNTALKIRMTPTLAKFISDNFSIVSHIESDDVVGSGFDATVWRGNPNAAYAGKIYVSLQGTTGFQDIETDIDLTANGVARDQVVAMINWWLKITTPEGQPARQIVYDESQGGQQFILAPTVPGTGSLVGASSIEVNGHSLGGHLATAFARLFGGSNSIAHVSSFNSAGFTSNSESIFGALENLLGTGTGHFLEDKQANYFAVNGINVTTRTLMNIEIGERTELYNEESVNPAPNHFMYKLTDMLALADAMSLLQVDLTLAKMNILLQSAASQKAASLESMLDAIRVYLGGASVGKTMIGDVGDSAPSRVLFHENIQELASLQNEKFQALRGMVTFSATNSGQVSSQARTDFFSFLTLTTLASIEMRPIAGNDVAVEQTLQSVWSELHGQWAADKDAEHPQYFSDVWIKDRSAMLSWLMQANSGAADSMDANGVIRTGASLGVMPDTWEFIDEKLSIHLLAAPGRNKTHLVFFGDSEGRLTEGYSDNDRLYGGAGDDTLKGNDGADYLEGNEGSDTLEGGKGKDILVGLADNDMLNGGKDADRLEGGKGTDTYVIAKGDGVDTIFDSDGLGTIKVGGVTLTGGKKDGENSWISADKKLRYVLMAAAGGAHTLQVFPVGGNSSGDPTLLYIEKFTSGNLGIHLEDAPVPDPLQIRVVMGDVQATEFEAPNGTGGTYLVHHYDDLGNVIGTAGSESRADELFGSAGKDEVHGGAGNDSLHGRDGDDVLSGEAGADLVTGGQGRDDIKGGDGNDMLYGDSTFGVATTQADLRVWGSDVPPPVAGATFLTSGINWARYQIAFAGLPAVSNTHPDAITPVLHQLSPTRFGTVRLFRSALTTYGQNEGGGDVIDAGAGDDTVYGEAGDDYLLGGSGDDHLQGGSGDDVLDGGDDNDLLMGDDMVYAQFRASMLDLMGTYRLTTAVETYENEFGNDLLFGGSGDDYLFGMAGADMLYGQAGNDYLVGDFFDIVSIPVLRLSDDGSEWVQDTSTHFTEAVQYHGNDVLDGGEGDDYLVGLAGNDQLLGGAGADVLIADGNPDEVRGRYGNDYLEGGDGNDLLLGSGGDDELHGGTGDDELWGDEYAGTNGEPLGSWGNAPVNSSGQTAQLAQSKHGKDWLDGGDGNDTLTGGGFDDRLEGGAGNDLLFGDGIGVTNEGNDLLFGGEGDDELQGNGGDDVLSGDEGADRLYGGEGADILQAGLGDDYLEGGKGADKLSGSEGQDTLWGNEDDDILEGGNGDDSLDGGEGNDTINGGAGIDYLKGGAGDDAFILRAGDGEIRDNGFETLDDTTGTNTLRFDGISAGSITVRKAAIDGDLALQYGSNDGVYIKGGLNGAIDAFSLGFNISPTTVVSPGSGSGPGVHVVSDPAMLAWFYYVGSVSDEATAPPPSPPSVITPPVTNTVVASNAGTLSWMDFLGYYLDDSIDVRGDGVHQALAGGRKSDHLVAVGAEIISGGGGDDAIELSGAGNTLMYRLGDGRDTLQGFGSGQTRIRFGQGIAMDDIHLRIKSDPGFNSYSDMLCIDVGDEASGFDMRRLVSRASLSAYGDTVVFEFSDGSEALLSHYFANGFEFTGTSGADQLYGTDVHDTLSGGSGNDSLYAGSGDDLLLGEDGSDYLVGGDGNDALFGAEGSDSLYGDSGVDSLDGGAGNDELSGGDGNDTLLGADEQDTLYGGNGDDLLSGGTGIDVLNGDEGNDTLLGGVGNDALRGGNGTDFLDGGAGNDVLEGGEGVDTYLYRLGDGDDTLNDQGSDNAVDTLRFGEGITASNLVIVHEQDDLLIRFGGTYGKLRLTGAANPALPLIERVEFADGSVLTAAELLARSVSGPVAVYLHGTEDGDVLQGEGLGDRLEGMGGNDVLYGLAGNDLMDGGAGDDSLYGGDGNDTLSGADGHDVLYGESGADSLDGGADADFLSGGAGADTLNGAAGTDVLHGGTGSDHLYGGDDDDYLNGDDSNGAGQPDAAADYLYGGGGNDTYWIRERADQIIEYTDEGIDTVYVYFSGTWALPDNIEVIHLETTNESNQITANAFDNRIHAGHSSYEQSTNTALGADTLIGGDGNDTYYNVSFNDVVVESANGGIDSVYTSDVVFTLGAYVENATTQSISVGVAHYGRSLYGNDQDNILTAGTSEVTFISAGRGNDTINGGGGNDQLYGNDGDDLITGGGGSDYLSGGTGSNVLQGGMGNDNLISEGGNDALAGGEGNDHLVLGTGFANCIFYSASGDDRIETGLGGFALDFRSSNLNDITNVTAQNGMLRISYLSQEDQNTVSTLDITLSGLDKLTQVKTLDNTMTAAVFYQWLNDHPDRYVSTASPTGDGSRLQVQRSGNEILIQAENYAGIIQNSFGIQNGTLIDPFRIEPNGALRYLNAGNGIASLTFNQGYGNAYTLHVGTDGSDDFFAKDQPGFSDRYVGGKGADTYYFGPDSGSDVIDVGQADQTQDVIHIGSVKAMCSFDFSWDSNNLSVSYVGSNKRLLVIDYFSEAIIAPKLVFSNGEVLTIDGFFLQQFGATSGNDVIAGATTDDVLFGWTGNDILKGMDGNDGLNGGVGADQMTGGNGDDYYIVDNAGDTVVELANGGIDSVSASVDFILPVYVENGGLLGRANLNITGNSGNNALWGNDGNNRLDGGTGADYLQGLDGSDTYVVDNATTSWVMEGVTYVGDYIQESDSSESGVIDIDTVESSVAYTLGSYLENLTLTGSSAIAGTGNELDNVLRGNSGANVLKGKAGNDTYYVSTGDTVTENANEGTDTVISDVTFVLGSNIENLTLVGSAAINATGNALANVIVGNGANNAVDGGAGVDMMSGGLGDDRYVVTAGDIVIENANAGIDTVQSSIAWSLASLANVENLTLTGSSVINGTGNALDNVLTGNSAVNVLTGGAGNDTYVVTSGDSVVENANEGIDTIQSNMAWSLASLANVENLTLTGTSNINGTGNALGNVLTGNSGTNQLSGGAGNDTYVVGTGDTIIENASEGTDTVMSSITWTLASLANVENLTLTGTGTINGTGNALANVIIGNDGNNMLDGGAGIDSLQGGVGNDSYAVDNTADVVIEQAGAGIDLVNASVTYALAANIENLTLTGSSAINGTGNALDNVLTGNSGINVLTGGAGNDSYAVTAGDSVVEAAGEGIDTILSGITWSLAALANVENLTLTGSSAINATGNALGNVLTGNTGANQLTGGAGNDTYVVGTGDTIVENANDGIDTILSSITWTLASTTHVENLTLTGSTAINATGNALDNILTGNSGANTLAGGTGNDTYYVSTGDTVTEAASAGTDTVISDVTWTLASTVNIENLTLTGSAAINATGNTLANVLRGNAGSNTLTGAAGNDIYLFGRGGTADTIVDTDTTAGNADKLLLDGGIAYDQLWFKHVGTGLEVSVIGTSDKVTISNWYNGVNNHVEKIQVADGHYLVDTKVEALVQAMAGMTPPALGETALSTAQHQQLDSVLAANWAA